MASTEMRGKHDSFLGGDGPCRRQSGLKTRMALMVTAVLAAGCFNAPPADAAEPIGKTWPPAQQVSMDAIDHAPFTALLKKYVDDDGYADYSRWHRSESDRQALRRYLTSLSRASRSLPASREATLAFWINAYNALTLEGILQVYPTDSIRNHTAKLFGYNIWEDLPLLVGGRAYSLKEIEHDVLRKMGEPRIHFAIVCASVGCPRLRNEAYMAERLEQQLAGNTRDFFSRPKNLQIDVRRKTLRISAILDWYAEDFGSSQAARLEYLKPYLPEAAARLAGDPAVRVEFLEYDWSLNDQARKPNQ